MIVVFSLYQPQHIFRNLRLSIKNVVFVIYKHLIAVFLDKFKLCFQTKIITYTSEIYGNKTMRLLYIEGLFRFQFLHKTYYFVKLQKHTFTHCLQSVLDINAFSSS